MPDKQFIDEIVKAHNEYRSRHQVRAVMIDILIQGFLV